MKQQNDWYTGSDHYVDYSEKQIEVVKETIVQENELRMHERVELLYVTEGDGTIEINGVSYEIKEGSFLCLYMHHFYRYIRIRVPIQLVSVKFYIGVFMFMCWEKHPRNANAVLVYDTCPKVQLEGTDALMIQEIAVRLLSEVSGARFSSRNLITYMTLQLHAYHCRFAFEGATKEPKDNDFVWKMIPKITLSPGANLNLDDFAKEAGITAAHLNQKIKLACGCTFFQLLKFGKIMNACALLHFSELSMNYISDLLNFSSVNTFYRVFKEYVHMTPREYQITCIAGKDEMLGGSSSALLFLQYMHLNFNKEISIKTMSSQFRMKEYTIRLIFSSIYKVSFHDLLEQIRISYACSFLSATAVSITKIASLCGFESNASFQRAFKKYMNQNPNQFRTLTKPGFV